MQRHRKAVTLVAAIAVCLLAFVSCGGASDSDGSRSTSPATPGANESAPAVAPTTAGSTVSDALPTIEELINTGLSEEEAECFLAELDPEGVGRLTDATYFQNALACTSDATP